MVKDESKGMEDFKDLDEFEVEALIIEGKDARIEDKIEFYDINTKTTKKMRIYIQPYTHDEWNKAVRKTRKNERTDLEELICSKCWLDKDGMPLPLSKIKAMQKGVVTQVYEKIKIISGQLNDPFEEKYLKKLMEDF